MHRDIKPSNIIITPEGRAKIVDMGLARNLDRAANLDLTQSGVTLGTFDYISPEQAIEPRAADVRSDLYSLGCTFYHLLTGVSPVPEGTAAKKLHYHQHVAPRDPRELNPEIPAELAAILGRLMTKDPLRRYQHPDDLLPHLFHLASELNLSINGVQPRLSRAIPTEGPLPAPPRFSVIWAAALIGVLVVALVAATGGFNSRREPLDQTPFWQTSKPTPPRTHTDKTEGGTFSGIDCAGQRRGRWTGREPRPTARGVAALRPSYQAC